MTRHRTVVYGTERCGWFGPSHTIPSQPTPFHPTPFPPIPPLPVPSHPNPTAHHPIPSHPASFRPIPSHLIPSHIPPHPVPYHPIPSPVRQIVTAMELPGPRVGVILMEYCPRGNLFEELNRLGGNRMGQAAVLSITNDVVRFVTQRIGGVLKIQGYSTIQTLLF